MSLRDGIRLRPAGEADLAVCEDIWRDAINDYSIPLGQHEIPPDNPSLRQLHAHTLATDPGLFWVATRLDGPAAEERVLAFAAAVRREAVWFLSMLFVRPGSQHAGLGRELLRRVLPQGNDATLAVATDAAQPASNGLYASVGMVPRMPMFNIVGRPVRPDALAPLPAGIQAVRLDGSKHPAGRGNGLDAELAQLDRSALGFAHPEDHAFVRGQSRTGFAYRDGSGRLLGYGYASEVGRIGPIAVADAALHAPITADLLEAVVPRGLSAIWVPGHAGRTMEMLIAAGLRIEGFPVLLAWSRSFADFSRYLPISPGLL